MEYIQILVKVLHLSKCKFNCRCKFFYREYIILLNMCFKCIFDIFWPWGFYKHYLFDMLFIIYHLVLCSPFIAYNHNYNEHIQSLLQFGIYTFEKRKCTINMIWAEKSDPNTSVKYLFHNSLLNKLRLTIHFFFS